MASLEAELKQYTESEAQIFAQKLHFGKGNAKLNVEIATFSLPAGVTCPFAHLCKTWVGEDNKLNQKLLNEEDAKRRYRCFAASMEVRYPAYAKVVNYNLNLLQQCKSKDEMVKLINESLPKDISKVRIHVGGDFYCEDYFNAWNEVAKLNPEMYFYAYTKSIPYWVKAINEISPNFILTASYGGLFDELIEQHDLKRVKIYFHPDQAKADGVEIDHDDSIALNPNVKRFGLLLHGSQPKGSEASQAIKKMKEEHIEFGYSSKPKQKQETTQQQ